MAIQPRILGSEIIKTTNGGENWLLVEYYNNPALSDIYFFDQTKGIAVGEDGCVIVSTNSEYQLNNRFAFKYGCIFFVTDIQTGFGFRSGDIYIKTTNGGNNWSEEDFGFSSNKQFLDAQVTPDGKIHAIGTFGTILISENGGINWQINSSVTENTLSEVYL